MKAAIVLPLLVATSGVAVAQDAPSRAAAAADRFALDLPAEAASPAPAPPEPATVSAPTAAPGPVDKPVNFSLDTPIALLIADPRARKVLDKDLPGLSTDENLAKFEMLTLRQFAPQTGGQLDATLLTRTAIDLAAITAGAAPTFPPPTRGKPVGR